MPAAAHLQTQTQKIPPTDMAFEAANGLFTFGNANPMFSPISAFPCRLAASILAQWVLW
jgi:hypothetical protein